MVTQKDQERSELTEYVRNTAQMGQLASLEAILDQTADMEGVAKLKRAQEAAAIRQLTGVDPPAAGEDMKTIIFGNVTHQAQKPASQPALSGLAKLGIAAALVASGGGAGAAIPLAISALTKDVPAVVQPLPPTNTDTLTERDYEVGEVTIESGAGE